MNRLYYVAAIGAVAIFIAAIIGLASCSDEGSSMSPAEDAVKNAYQQGYLDGYSKGYADGFAAGLESVSAEQTSYATPTRTGCAPSCAVDDSAGEESAAGDEQS